MAHQHHDIEFSRRVDRLTRKNVALSRGYATHMRPDGLLVTAPARPRARLSLRLILLFVAAFFAFKAFLIASAGAVTYDARVERLHQGTLPEAAAAWVLQSDPVSRALSAQMARLLP